jgi:thymidylate kinase
MGKRLTPLVVEFLGLPGVGKTTVLSPVAAQLQAAGISIVLRNEILQQWQALSGLQRLRQWMPSTLNQWQVLMQSVGLAAQVKPINLPSFSKAVKIFSNLKRLDQIQSPQLVLLDQGMLQETWSVGITGEPPTEVQLRSRLAPLFDQRSLAIVYFKADPNLALDRLQQRSTQNSRLNQMSPQTAQAMLSRYAPYLDDILATARSRQAPILEIDSDRPVAEKAEKIAHWITHLIVEP